ncbi:MAG TPA: family 78 glycoside hydrolase catalytic domain, partial [Terrimicrobiaceae bacterium]|nr:family 78 glycoside hydrolase catalytic domain [Terrimicrobiaceae bacterium]
MLSRRLRRSSLGVLAILAAQSFAAAAVPENLRAEYLSQPLGLDVARPALSWTIRSDDPDRRGLRQSAYRLLVASDEVTLAGNRGDLWDSGKVPSDQMASISYAGQPLRSGQQCFWKAMVWDEADQPGEWSPPTSWTMGLLAPSDWRAQWIGAQPRQQPPTAENFGYRSAIAKKKETPKWLQIDLGGVREFSAVRLWPAWPLDIKSPPGDGFPARFRIEAADSPDFAGARLLVDRTAEDMPNPRAQPVLLEFPAVRARYVRLTATHLDGQYLASWDASANTWVPRSIARDEWRLALAEMEVLSGDRNLAAGAAVTDSDKTKETLPGGWSPGRLTDGQTQGHAGSDYEIRPAILLRKPFTVRKGLRRATLFSSALGCYEVSLNGLRIRDEQLAPGWTIYDKRVLYQTYDLTAQLRAGENMLGAHVGDGWFRMPREMFDQFDSAKRFAGYKSYPGSEGLWFLGQLQLEYDDGTTELVTTDKSWLCQPEGPVRTASMFTGVLYDANFEAADWDRPGAANTGWQPAVARPLADGQILSSQKMEPIRVLEEIRPVRKVDLGHGRTMYDFGRVIAGVCRVTAKGKSGDILKLRHAEALLP